MEEKFQNTTAVICQNLTCRRQGSGAVLKRFQELAEPALQLEPSGCLGHCGNGPMVLVLPDEVWYRRVTPEIVSAIVAAHLHS